MENETLLVEATTILAATMIVVHPLSSENSRVCYYYIIITFHTVNIVNTKPEKINYIRRNQIRKRWSITILRKTSASQLR